MTTSSISQAPVTAGVPVETPAPPRPTAEQRALIQAVKAIQATGRLGRYVGEGNELSFSIDRITQQVVVRVVNRDTRQIVRRIPQETLLRMAREPQTLY